MNNCKLGWEDQKTSPPQKNQQKPREAHCLRMKLAKVVVLRHPFEKKIQKAVLYFCRYLVQVFLEKVVTNKVNNGNIHRKIAYLKYS